MRIALIADLHGNKTALSAFEKDIISRSVDGIWCLGDLVGKGPCSDYTFDWAVANCSVILRGNWDEDLGNRVYAADEYYFNQLGDKRLKQLLTFPVEKHMYIAGKKLRLLHGRPSMEAPIFIQAQEDKLSALFEPDFNIVGYADIHRQALRILNCGLLFNVGSIGNSLGIVRVQYAILTASEGVEDGAIDIELINLPYDVQHEINSIPADFPYAENYIQELTYGVYSRKPKR